MSTRNLVALLVVAGIFFIPLAVLVLRWWALWIAWAWRGFPDEEDE